MPNTPELNDLLEDLFWNSTPLSTHNVNQLIAMKDIEGKERSIDFDEVPSIDEQGEKYYIIKGYSLVY